MTDLKIKRFFGALVIFTDTDFKFWRICLVVFFSVVFLLSRERRGSFLNKGFSGDQFGGSIKHIVFRSVSVPQTRSALKSYQQSLRLLPRSSA